MLASNSSQASAKAKTLKLPVVRQGSSGSAVRVLQQVLNFKGFNLEVDGDFGWHTLEGVKEFQQANGLVVDGIVDAKTWQRLSFGLLEFTC
ncbi:MAG TPA: peptidoglycan-binding domain-containing protein [Candidatus Sericytochromatia bacterium]|jgi:peptidoglycan hydrolase-like protein with peptidoglycan-binding domain